MSNTHRNNRLASPLMYAFRSAHEAKDARKRPDASAEEKAGAAPVVRRIAGRAAITEPRLRREVTRDVGALLNTVNLDSTLDLAEHPEVRRSILNFGLPDLTDRTIDEQRVEEIAEELRRALLDYEPRLLASGLTAVRDMSVSATDLKIRFSIKADLLCNPVNVPVEFTADVEIDTGKIRIDRI